ncbi:MAG: AAA family ATPase [Candidatus Aminicenantales bacterium]
MRFPTLKKTGIKLLGLTGTNGAGKGEAAAYFVSKGYAYFSLSDIIREELEKRGVKMSRNNLIKMGNELRNKHGADVLARRVMEKIKQKSVIDSIRNPKEVEYLKKQPHFFLIAFDAPVEVRYERIKKRGRDESASTLEEFIHKEREEMTGDEKAQQLRACMAMADVTIINDSTLEDLHCKLEVLL